MIIAVYVLSAAIITELIIVAVLLLRRPKASKRRKVHEPGPAAAKVFDKSERTKADRKPIYNDYYAPEIKIAGIMGELTAQKAIESVLREDDNLLHNVEITFEDRKTELDFVVVNSYGVFVIEVKNYKGELVGSEDDFEWMKYKTTTAGNTYEKTVRNPIKQVKRQIDVLARYLKQYGVNVWVKGYAVLLWSNSPVESEHILRSIPDIDQAIHTTDRRMLDVETIRDIVNLLSIQHV